MNPFFFGDSGSPLFGTYHAPAEGGGHEAVLICPPVGHEYLRAHRALRLLADSLAASGRHVLRFDYAGTGDSAGGAESMTMDGWLRSVTVALDELRDISGAGRMIVVGLRLGAMLAGHALRRVSDVRAMVMWDPVADGSHYLDELDALHHARLRSFETGRGRRMPSVSDPLGTIMGFPYPPVLREHLRRMRLPVEGDAVPPSIGIAASADRPEYRSLAQDYRTRGARVTHRVAPDLGNWSDFQSVGGVMPAPRVSQVVAELVCGESP